MGHITLTCIDCGQRKTFSGLTSVEVIDAIDAAQWRDFFDDNTIKARCPECDEKDARRGDV